jgi:hypothetical protein
LPVEQAVERAGGLDVPEQFAVHGRGQVVVDDGDGAGGYLARVGLGEAGEDACPFASGDGA